MSVNAAIRLRCDDDCFSSSLGMMREPERYLIVRASVAVRRRNSRGGIDRILRGYEVWLEEENEGGG